MKIIKRSVFRSLSAKLTAVVLIVVSVVFTVAFFSYYSFARNQVQHEAILHAESALSSTVIEMNKIIVSVEIAVENMSWTIREGIANKEHLDTLLERFVTNNPFIFGSAIAFEPECFASGTESYVPYSFREGGVVRQKKISAADYQYEEMEWYKSVKEIHTPQWSEPYYDKGGGEFLMTTYSMPLMDKDGKFYGAFTADVSLSWLTETLNALKPYPHSFNVMMGKEGVFIVHPDKKMILRENAFTAATALTDDELREYGKIVKRRESGMLDTTSNGKEIFVFFAPIEKAGWFVCIVCPQEEIFESVQKMRSSVLLVFVGGLVVLALLCFLVIRRLTSPLQKFAASAIHIAEGDIRTTLPDIHSNDEMASLRDSFHFMQESLVRHIEELKVTTANRERIESELRIANAIQMGMLPKVFPTFPDRKGMGLYAVLKPAREVGGDLYHFFIQGDQLFFCIGDVSGKGIPASLIMSVICRSVRRVAEIFGNLPDIFGLLNNMLVEGNDSNMFCTFFLGVLDFKTGVLKYCNAGHNAPYIITPKGTDSDVSFCVEALPVDTNLPLGLIENFRFQEQELVMTDNSSLFLYTDGVTEAENDLKELFSDERLVRILKDSVTCSPQEKIERVLADIRQFANKAEQSDDITMLCLSFTTRTANG